MNQMRYAVGHGHDPVVQQDGGLGIQVQVRFGFSSFQLDGLTYSLLWQLTVVGLFVGMDH